MEGYIDRAVNVLLVTQRQVPTIQKIQKTIGIPQAQFEDELTDVPVAMRASEAQKTLEVPLYIDRIVDVRVLMQRQVPTIQTVQKISILIKW